MTLSDERILVKNSRKTGRFPGIGKGKVFTIHPERFKSSVLGMPVNIKYPDDENLTCFKSEKAKEFINQLEQQLTGDTINSAYLEMIDIHSFIDYWFVSELTQNRELHHPRSLYVHLADGILKAGPCWDYDWETFKPMDEDTLCVRNAWYYTYLFQDSTFCSLVKEKWATEKEGFERVVEQIDSLKKLLSQSDSLDCRLWPLDGQHINGDESLSFEEAVAKLKKTLSYRIMWLDGAISTIN